MQETWVQSPGSGRSPGEGKKKSRCMKMPLMIEGKLQKDLGFVGILEASSSYAYVHDHELASQVPLVVKEPICQCRRDVVSIPGSGRSPE